MVFSGYKIKEVLYQSSISTTYRAVKIDENSLYVIKVLKDAYLKPDESVYFMHDYETAKRINYPEGVMFPIDVIESDKTIVIVYEDFQAESLAKIIEDNTLTIYECFEISIRLVKVLEKVHDSKITNKDISPHNVLYNRHSKKLCIIDFGIASDQLAQTVSFVDPDNIEGAVAYISPEQTGRVNLDVDYRSDFYSLGATLYELFTGHTLFSEDSILATIQAHLSKEPTFPIELNPNIPLPLANFIMKLLSKYPSERYKSTQGILWDLSRCFTLFGENSKHLKQDKSQNGFILGEKDFSSKLMISNKIYGRMGDKVRLLKELELACQGQHRCVFISGSAGTGKTSLVREVYAPLTLKSGMFVSGKFDQLYKTPYSAFLQALNKVIIQVISSGEKNRSYWKQRIISMLGENAHLITEMFPNLEKLIGYQAPVKIANIQASKERLTYLIKRFIACFSEKNHPLVLFIDDLQWLDDDSLALLPKLLDDDALEYLLIICAYRDEVSQSPPQLRVMIDQALKYNSFCTHIPLQPLTSANVQQLIEETLIPAGETVNTLSDVIQEQASGNPYIVKEILKSFYDDNLIYFDIGKQCWIWDLDGIKKNIDSDITSLLSKKLRRLPKSVFQIIQAAACIGHTFSLADLSLITHKPNDILIENLNNLALLGIIDPLESAYRLVYSKFCKNFDLHQFKYKFTHDRMQQVLYTLSNDQENEELHFTLAEALFRRGVTEEGDPELFNIMGHYQIAIHCIHRHDDRERVMQLFIDAGERALSKGMFSAALNYLSSAKLLLSTHAWEDDYKTTLRLHTHLSTVLLCLNESDSLFQCTKEVIPHVKNSVDAFPIHRNHASGLIINQKFEKARIYLTTLLHQCHVKIPSKSGTLRTFVAIIQSRVYISLIKKRDPEQLPLVSEDSQEFRVRKYVELYVWCFSKKNFDANVLAICCCEFIKRIPRHGLDLGSATAVQNIAVFYISGLWDFDTSRKIVSFSDQLISRFPSMIKSASFGLYYFVKLMLVAPWIEPLSKTLEPMMQRYSLYMGVGEVALAEDLLAGKMMHQLMLTPCLVDIIRESDHYRKTMRSSKTSGFYTLSIINQSTQNFICPQGKPWLLEGIYFSESESMWMVESYTIMHQFFLTLKMQLAYLFGHYQESENLINLIQDKVPQLSSMNFTAWLMFYRCLTYQALYKEGSSDKSYLIKIKKDMKIVEKMAKSCPQNYFMMYIILQGSRFYALSQYDSAEAVFLTALEKEEEFQHILMRALLHEMLFKLYIKIKKHECAKKHLNLACSSYRQWGAEAKVKQLQASDNMCEKLIE